MKKKDTAIVIVNWNGKHLLKDCLDSLQKQTYEYFKIFIVDNGSTDGSVSFIKKNYPNTELIVLKENTGFAFPNNLAIREIIKNKDFKWVITLNNDTKADKNFVKNLVNSIQNDETLGSVAPKMLNFYDKDVIDGVGIVINKDGGGMNRGHKEKDYGQYDKEEEIFGVCAGAAIYNIKMIKDIMINDQFFDEDYFAYYEDLDVAWRARLLGWKSLSCPNSVVMHVHSATSISFSPFKAFHVNRNRALTMIKNFPLILLIYSFFLTVVRYFLLLVSIFRKKGPSYELTKKTNILTPFLITFKAWGSVLILLPKTLLKRFRIQKRRSVSIKEIFSFFTSFGVSLKKMIF